MKIIKNDKEKRLNSKKKDLIIILDNLRSVANVGNIFRLAEAIGIKAIYGLGYTPLPPHEKLKKIARGTEEDIFSQTIDDWQEFFEKLKKKSYSIIGVDTIEKSQIIYDFIPPKKLVLIFGNEALGIREDILRYCDKYIHLPMNGYKNSINVSNCVSVVLYHINKFMT